MDPTAIAAEPLPTIPGFPFLHAAAGALISGPTGGGRSSLMQACAYDAARQGVRVAYLGSEVTESEFNARAADLANRRGDGIDGELQQQLASVRYLNLASAIAQAWQHPAAWAEQIASRFDVVVTDPLSAVASVLDLDFDKANAEFVRFYDRLVQPVVDVGVAVVLLENIGHAIEARSRAKGVSAKQDRADLTFSCKPMAQPVGLIISAFKVRSVRAPFHRGDSWTFDRDTQRIQRGDTQPAGEHAFRPTVLMERVSRAIEAEPGLTRRGVRSAVGGKHEARERALDLLIGEGYVQARQEGQLRHHSARPYRAAEDTPPSVPLVAPLWPPEPELAAGPLAPALKGQGPGDSHNGASAVAPTGNAAPRSAIFDCDDEAGPDV